MRLSEKINGSQTSAYEGILKSALNESENLKEARSHKEDNEKAAPRTVINKNGMEVKTREMVDVSNPKVGNHSYHNEKGSQYWGTTEADYASKRNKTGKKNEFGYDVYTAPFKNKGDWKINADKIEPATATERYQYNKNQSENDKERIDYYTKELKRVRSPYKKAVAQNQIDSFEKSKKEHDDKAHQIYQDMKDKRNNEKANKKNESCEKKSIKEDTFDKAVNGEINYSVYDDKDERNLKDRYREPIHAKRNKIRNFKDNDKNDSVRNKFNKGITHVDYEKSPNEKVQEYKKKKLKEGASLTVTRDVNSEEEALDLVNDTSYFDIGEEVEVKDWNGRVYKVKKTEDYKYKDGKRV